MHLYLLISTYLLVFLLPLLCRLHASPAPDPYPAVVSLPQTRSPRHLSTHAPEPQVDHDLLPFVLVSTIDGALHAVDREGGKIRWTLKDGVEPLIGGGVRGKGNDDEYIVEPLSGGLYVFDEDEEGSGNPKVRRLPLSVEQLIELSPFTFPHSPSRIFTGSKQSSLLTIDLRTGNQLDCFSSFASNLTQLADDCSCDADLDGLEGKSRSPGDLLFVGRNDYRLTIHSPRVAAYSTSSATSTPAVLGPHGVQEITYSTYIPNSYDKPLADYWSQAGHARRLWEENGEEAKKLRVELGHDGVAVGVEEGGGVKWITKLGSIGIAVYDILLPLSPGAKPVLVPQPPPDLPSLFPLPREAHSGHLDILKRPPSTYIGAVPSTLELAEVDTESPQISSAPGTPENPKPRRLLYALSSTSYPLINFAPPARPGTLSNGSFLLTDDIPEQDRLLPYRLDPPKEEIPTIDGPHEEVAERPTWIFRRSSPRRGWWVWMLGALSFLAVCGLAISRLGRKARGVHAVTPPDETTPLLVKGPDNEKAADTEAVIDYATLAKTPRPTPEQKTERVERSVKFEEADDVTPKKKQGRRRVRGKKKKRDSPDAADVADGDEEDDNEDAGESGSGSQQGRSPRSDDKPLPDLPRQISTVALRDENDKESLSISDCIIGFGSHGTVVLKGTWGGRPVAVKRLLSDFTRLASQEVKLLQASDDHPNVIRYYCQERRDNFLYIALDLCQASLADLIESPDKHLELASALDRKKALLQVTGGLKHLHGMKIIHRDIKPQNVLVSQAKDGSLRMLVSDFGLARRLEQDQSSFAPTANNLAGSLGWRAPECIQGQVRLNEDFDPRHSSQSSSSSSSDLLELSSDEKPKERHRLTKAVDLFALGCLYFWVIMSGEHPYGATYDRESNIVKGDIVNLSALDIMGEEGWEARALITSLLSMHPAARPDTAECLVHPFFWTPAKRLNFLCDASDRFEIMEVEPPEPTLVMLEADAPSVIGRDWYTRVDKLFINNLGKYRKYKGHSVRDLLRAMRNKKHHYQDLEPGLKRHLGALPGGFLQYFTSRYPTLFLHVYGVIRDSRLRKETMFDAYFTELG